MKSINKKIVLFLLSFSNKGKRIQTNFLLALSIFVSQSDLQAQSINVTSVPPSAVCAGSTVTITFTVTNGNGTSKAYDSNTQYSVFLTDATGTNYTQIGASFSKTASYQSGNGSSTTGLAQTITIPTATAFGTGYKIAVGSTLPTFNGSSGTGASGTFTINALPSAPGAISGAATQCPGLTNQTYSIPAVLNATTYNWTVPTGWLITSGSGTNSIHVTTGSAAQNGNITVAAANSCGTSAAQTLAVTVSPASVGGTASGNQNICSGSTPANISLSGQNGTIQWQSSSDNTTFTTIASATASTLTGAQMGSLTATTYYRAVVTSGVCASANSTIVAVTVNPLSVGGTASANQNICSGSTPANISLSGQTGTIQWQSSSDNMTFTTIVSATASTLTGAQMGSLTTTQYYRAVVTSGVCASANSTVVTVTVTSCINKWKGSISNDWNTAANWTQNFVPAVDANLVFDDSPAHDCYLDQDRSVTNITNSQGVYGIVLNGQKLTLKGNLVFTGGATIDASASNSTMQFSGLAVQSISTEVFKNAAVYNLKVTNSNNVVLNGNLRLLNNLTATTGLLDAFTNSPTITYAGNAVQTIENNQFLGGKIVNLTVDNVLGVDLNTNFTITNTLVINNGKKLAVSTLYQLTALGTISNNAGTSGLILQSNANGTASLIHNTDNLAATVQRYISGPTAGWHFLSAPVSNQSISGSWLPLGSYGTGNMATGTGFDLYLWDEPSFSFKYKLDTTPIGWNTVHAGPNFSAGRGYLYSLQAVNPTKEFIGNLNNGPVNYPISRTETLDTKLIALKGFNLVGNPYPSSVDWQAASGWDRSKLEVSGGGSDMWVWNPTANNYGVFNSASGVGTNSISRYIAPMQGYFVKAISTGNLAFDNRVRIHTGAGNWFKNTGIKNPIIRIAVESEDGNGADEALLQFGYSNSNQGTSKLFSHVSKAPSLYLNVEDEKYSVRYLTNTAENNAVPMEFKAGKEGVYKLKFNFDSKELDFIQLEDRLLKTFTSVKPVSSYLFKSSKEDSVSRFVLHFKAAEIPTKKELNGLVYMDGSQIAVNLIGINGQTEIKVFDTAGKLLLQKYFEGSGLTKLDLNVATQMLLVRLTNVKGASTTKVLFSPLQQ